MNDTPKARRKFTEAERLARLENQRRMILKRAAEKRRERIVEAEKLLEGIEEVTAARAELTQWLQANPVVA